MSKGLTSYQARPGKTKGRPGETGKAKHARESRGMPGKLKKTTEARGSQSPRMQRKPEEAKEVRGSQVVAGQDGKKQKRLRKLKKAKDAKGTQSHRMRKPEEARGSKGSQRKPGWVVGGKMGKEKEAEGGQGKPKVQGSKRKPRAKGNHSQLIDLRNACICIMGH